MHSPSTSLVVINDTEIWKRAFSKLEKVMFNIDLLETRIASFSGEQLQFETWLESTFRNRKDEIAALGERLRNLERLHNWALKVSRSEGISFEQAYQKMVDEQKAYTRGNEAERARIDFIRRERDIGPRHDDEEDDREDGRNDESEELIRSVEEMSEKELRQSLQNPDFALSVLLAVLTTTAVSDKLTFFVRIFDFTSHYVRDEIAEPFATITGRSLDDVVEDMRETLAERTAAPAESQKANPDAEPLKRAYHRLVRALHPDLHPADEPGALWRSKLWNRGQDAFRRQDRPELENLFVLYSLRTKKFGTLTFSDINQSHEWLKRELKGLQKQTKALKKSPAWNFATRPDRDQTKEKLEIQFNDERRMVLNKIEELEGQRDWILHIANSEQARAYRNERARGRDRSSRR